MRRTQRNARVAVAVVLGVATLAFLFGSFRSSCFDYVSGGECFIGPDAGDVVLVTVGAVATFLVARSARPRK